MIVIAWVMAVLAISTAITAPYFMDRVREGPKWAAGQIAICFAEVALSGRVLGWW